MTHQLTAWYSFRNKGGDSRFPQAAGVEVQEKDDFVPELVWLELCIEWFLEIC